MLTNWLSRDTIGLGSCARVKDDTDRSSISSSNSGSFCNDDGRPTDTAGESFFRVFVVGLIMVTLVSGGGFI